MKLKIDICKISPVELHQWLDEHAPGWTVDDILNEDQDGKAAFSVAINRQSVEWVSDQLTRFEGLLETSGISVAVYEIPDSAAMMARLTWPFRLV